MNDIDRNTLIQVNAIIITGLLILLTFQSVSAPIYENQITTSIEEMNTMGIKVNTIKNLYNENCINENNDYFTFLNSSEITEQCKKWEVQLVEAIQESSVIGDYVTGWYILEDNTATSLVKSIIWAPWISKIIITITILPFVISIITEFAIKREGPHASKISLIISGTGFVLLFCGLMMILTMLNCSVPNNPFWDCGQ